MKKILRVGLGISICSIGLMGLDIPTYYKLDIKAMEMTLEGSKERLFCLQNRCPIEEQYAIDDRVQERIQTLYQSSDTTASKHIGFYTKNSVEAEKYYDNNESLQEMYSQLEEEIEEVNSELKILREEGL